MNHKKTIRLFLNVLFVVVVTVVSFNNTVWAVDFLDDASYEEQAGAKKAYDPIEPFNRVVFTFNDKMFIWVLNPVATGYSKILPADIRGCFRNFFYNLAEPVRSLNCLLQGRFRDSGLTLSRFLINSTCGVFGFADPASKEFSIAPVYATLGETFSVWGVGDGFYLVVPFMGPSTLRDFAGTMGDSFAKATYYPWNDDDVTSITAYGANSINTISLHLGEYEELKSMSFDPYVSFRDGYFQMRSKKREHSKPSN
jgi:phospholipid-binding lipoprotein MlaA